MRRLLWRFVFIILNFFVQPAFSFIHSKRTPSRCSQHRLFGIKVTIRIVGRKTSEKWIEQGCQMYESRLKPNNIIVETQWHKGDNALLKGVRSDSEKSSELPIVLLDPQGVPSSSEVFANKFYDWAERGGSRLVFVIGGAEGLPPGLRSGAIFDDRHRKPTLFSLSQLTFTHQFARLVLMEQIYRASEIRKGSGYHK